MTMVQHANCNFPNQQKRLFKKGLAILLATVLSLTAILSFNPTITHAQITEIISLECSKDAYVDERYPNNNFGANTTLLLRSYSDENARVFLDFDYGTIPIGTNVINATLFIYLNSTVSFYRKYTMNVARGSWNETGAEGNITWNNQPGVDWGYHVDEVPVSPDTTMLQFDVTRAVQEYVCMDWQLDGFMIRDAREYDWRTVSEIGLVAREHSTKPCAVLNVTISFEPDFLLWVMPDYQNSFPGGSTSFWYMVASLNQWEGSIDLSMEGLHGTMTAIFAEDPLNLSPGDIRWGQLEIRTTIETPEGEYSLYANGTGSDVTHRSHVTLEMIPRVLVRDLPSTATNDTDFKVTLDYHAGTIDATSLIIDEELPEKTSLVNVTLPNADHAYFSSHQDDNRLRLKFVIANTTSLGSFSITYYVHLSYSPEQNPGMLHFDGRYKYLLANGVTSEANTLGDSEVEIPVGRYGSWDDDNRVDDWELLEIINAWIAGTIDNETLIGYIQQWQTTSW